MEDVLEDLKIVYEDNHIIVIIKPQNIPTQEDESEDDDMLSIVKQYIKEKYKKPGNVYVGLVHRLDRPTGGLLVFAKTSKAASRLSEQIRDGEFDKKYLAVVVGLENEKTKRLENYLKKDEKTNTVKVVPMSEVGAKKAELFYTVLDTYVESEQVAMPPKQMMRVDERELLVFEEGKGPEPELVKMFTKINKALSLLQIDLMTGRSHQIRVQMASLKTPVFGDVKYGGNKIAGYNENNEGYTKNLALWAYELSFVHPTTKQKMSFKALPDSEAEPWNLFDLTKI